MEAFFYFYIAGWATACLIALGLYLREAPSYAISHADYWRFLAQPWKLTTFVTASAGITLIAPYTGDPTWDYVDALFMAVLTFASAPWTVGTLYLAMRGEKPARQAYVVFCAWMFSASWSYDIYLVFRDGDYPSTWFPNIFASSVLYLSGGLMWNLEYYPGRGTIFAFMREGWPSAPQGRQFGHFVWFALPFMLLVAAAILSFVSPIAFFQTLAK